MITEIADYFAKGCGRCPRFATPDCATRLWADELAALRRICLEAGLVETVKWGHPCYMHGTRNIALLGAFRGDLRISFFHAALLKDPARVLEKPGPNSRHPCIIRFVDRTGIETARPMLQSYLAEAIGYADAGILPPAETRDSALPEELVDALDSDPELAEAFLALTPGRQRSYVISLATAKTSTTRVGRIARFRDRILAGKGATER